MKHLDTFKIFESRQSQTLWGFWLHNFEGSLVGLLDKPTAKIISKILDDQLDPNGDDMYGISANPMKKNGGDIWFDGDQFTIRQGDGTGLSDDATPLHAKDLFNHPNQFISLEGDYEINGPWLNVMDAILKAYPDIKIPSPKWETVYKK